MQYVLVDPCASVQDTAMLLAMLSGCESDKKLIGMLLYARPLFGIHAWSD